MTTQRNHPSWDEIKGFLATGDPSLHAIQGEPPVAIFLDPQVPRVGLRTPLATGDLATIRPLTEIDVRLVLIQDERYLEVETVNEALFPYFHLFALALADCIQVDRIEARAALADSLDRWRDLLRQATMLSREQQTGLIGELWVLERLFCSLGVDSLEAWTGPRGEAHDFRVADAEFEVKTTRTERRVHTINGLTQLTPSPGRALHLVSLQFATAAPGEGRSLAERLTQVRRLFQPSGRGGDLDALVLMKYGIAETGAEQYREAVRLRTEPRLVHVGDDFPCLREEDIFSIPRIGMERISDVQYRLDVSGLGFSDGSPEFLSVLPGDGRSA